MQASTDMIFHKELKTIFEHIAMAFGFRMSVFGSDFREQTPGDAHPNCRYCRIIQEDLGLINECRMSDASHCRQAAITREAVFYTCHAGLSEAIYPLISKNKCIGYILVGQFRGEKGIPSHILSGAGSEDELHSAYESLPGYDTEKLKSILELIRITTRYIIENRILEQKSNVLAQRIIDYIEENNETNPKIEDLARYVRRSAATVNKVLKEATGQSFKQFSISVRLERGAILLREHPELTIQEVSSALGLEDPFYFSRLFKKNYGFSPREYRSKVPELRVHPEN